MKHKRNSLVDQFIMSATQLCGKIILQCMKITTGQDINTLTAVVSIRNIVRTVRALEITERYIFSAISPYAVMVGFEAQPSVVDQVSQYVDHVYNVSVDDAQDVLGGLSEPPFIVVVSVMGALNHFLAKRVADIYQGQENTSTVFLVYFSHPEKGTANSMAKINAWFHDRKLPIPVKVISDKDLHKAMNGFYKGALETIKNEEDASEDS